MKLIPLTQGKFAKVDDADYEYLMQWKWAAVRGKYTWYARRVVYESGKQRIITMHGLLLSILPNDGYLGDHIDKDGLNCQRDNIRKATRSQNNAYRKVQCNKTSVYMGVCRSHNKWAGQISKDGKKMHSPLFSSEIEAAKWYNDMAKKLHGNFATLNIV